MELMTLGKIVFTASVIVFASWLSQKKPELAGFIIALPLASLLALALAHFQHGDVKKDYLWQEYSAGSSRVLTLFLTLFYPKVSVIWILGCLWHRFVIIGQRLLSASSNP